MDLSHIHIYTLFYTFDICFNKVGLRLVYFTTPIGLYSHFASRREEQKQRQNKKKKKTTEWQVGFYSEIKMEKEPR